MKKSIWIFALLLTIAQGVWAWDGSGTQNAPYCIQNAADWQELADKVAAGESYSGKYFRLTADIDLGGVSVGGELQPFSGTFDGDGHTLTYNRGTSASGTPTYVDEYCAPFVLLEGATIRHLNVTGSIYSDHKQGAGIASLIDGSKPTTLIDCQVSSLLNAGPTAPADWWVSPTSPSSSRTVCSTRRRRPTATTVPRWLVWSTAWSARSRIATTP